MDELYVVEFLPNGTMRIVGSEPTLGIAQNRVARMDPAGRRDLQVFKQGEMFSPRVGRM